MREASSAEESRRLFRALVVSPSLIHDVPTTLPSAWRVVTHALFHEGVLVSMLLFIVCVLVGVPALMTTLSATHTTPKPAGVAALLIAFSAIFFVVLVRSVRAMLPLRRPRIVPTEVALDLEKKSAPISLLIAEQGTPGAMYAVPDMQQRGHLAHLRYVTDGRAHEARVPFGAAQSLVALRFEEGLRFAVAVAPNDASHPVLLTGRRFASLFDKPASRPSAPREERYQLSAIEIDEPILVRPFGLGYGRAHWEQGTYDKVHWACLSEQALYVRRDDAREWTRIERAGLRWDFDLPDRPQCYRITGEGIELYQLMPSEELLRLLSHLPQRA